MGESIRKQKQAPWQLRMGAGGIHPDMGTEADLSAEVTRARTKFPGSRFLLAALVEEVGELAEAVVAGDKEAIYKEAIQCACVSIRIAEEGDVSDYAPGLFIAVVTSTGRVARCLLQRTSVSKWLTALSGAANEMQRRYDPTFTDVTDEEAKP